MRLWLSATFVTDLVDRKVTLLLFWKENSVMTCHLLTNMCPGFTFDFLLLPCSQSQYSSMLWESTSVWPHPPYIVPMKCKGNSVVVNIDNGSFAQVNLTTLMGLPLKDSKRKPFGTNGIAFSSMVLPTGRRCQMILWEKKLWENPHLVCLIPTILKKLVH